MLINGDCLIEAAKLEENSVDLVLTDVPYGLSFMGKHWDKGVPSAEVLRQFLRVLKPGAWFVTTMTPKQNLLARLTINLEDAGFNVDFTSLYWTYASGFPKAQNISKAIDKKFGAEREVVGMENPYRDGGKKTRTGHVGENIVVNNVGKTIELQDGLRPVTAPATEEAKHFDGSYGGFQPKPAVEVVVVAMKPMDEKTFVGQALKNGKGITWLDKGRIPHANENFNNLKGNPYLHKLNTQRRGETEEEWYSRGQNNPGQQEALEKLKTHGRFPANLLVSDDVLDDDKKYNNDIVNKVDNNVMYFSCEGKKNIQKFEHNIISKIGYSRFFSLDAWVERNLPFLIVPKACKKEKNAGLDEEMKNTHPTAKPIKLFSYLLTIFSAEGDIVLDPYMGSGSTGVACVLNQRNFIGIELEEEYYKIAEARIEHHKPLVNDIYKNIEENQGLTEQKWSDLREEITNQSSIEAEEYTYEFARVEEGIVLDATVTTDFSFRCYSSTISGGARKWGT